MGVETKEQTKKNKNVVISHNSISKQKIPSDMWHTRATTNYYFHYQLIPSIIFLTNCLVGKMSEVPRVKVKVIRCCVLSNQQCKTQRYSIDSDIKQRLNGLKTANPHIGAAIARKHVVFFINKLQKNTHQLTMSGPTNQCIDLLFPHYKIHITQFGPGHCDALEKPIFQVCKCPTYLMSSLCHGGINNI